MLLRLVYGCYRKIIFGFVDHFKYFGIKVVLSIVKLIFI